MANSLRAKISKLRHDGNISDAEYQELIKKLDGHDKQIRAEAIEEVKSKMISFHTDAIFQYGADIIEAKSDAFDELRDWLKEQNMGNKWSLDDTGYDDGYKDGYNQALEDFEKCLIQQSEEGWCGMVIDEEGIKGIKEQLIK
mgnify:CR=1 FL=1